MKVPGDTLENEEAKALVDTVAVPLAEKEVEKLCDTISDVQHDARFVTFANKKAVKKAQTLADKLGYMQVEALSDTVKPKNLETH